MTEPAVEDVATTLTIANVRAALAEVSESTEMTRHFIESLPGVTAFLEYHRVREEAPRTACPDCQFEYSDMDEPHICNSVS